VATKAEKDHFRRQAEFGCILCYKLGYGAGTPSEIHHIRRAGKRDTAPTIPLCREHHRGDSGIHGMGRKAFEKHYNVCEEDLLDLILELL